MRYPTPEAEAVALWRERTAMVAAADPIDLARWTEIGRRLAQIEPEEEEGESRPGLDALYALRRGE